MKFLAQHKWAILMAVLVGVIMGLPHSYFVWKNHDAYQGIFLGGLDEQFYLARIQEVRDGHPLLANAVWAEGKGLPYLRPPGSEIIASSFGQIFGLNVINTVLLENFIFPAMVFLLIYFLVYQLIGKKSPALLASSLVLLASNLVGLGTLWNLLAKGQAANTFLFYTRLVSPQMHGLFFFGFFLIFWSFLSARAGLKKGRWFYGGLSGLFFGLSFYIYPYTWTFIGAFLGCLGIIFIFRRNWVGIKNLILIGGLAFLVAIPYFLNLWQAMHHPLYAELTLRTGIIQSRAPVFGSTVLLLLVLFLLFFPRADKKRFDFGLALVLAPLVVLNQQLLTGRLLTSAHYHYYYHKPLLIIFLVIVVFYQFKKSERSLGQVKNISLRRVLWGGLVTVALLIAFYNAWLVQASSYRSREAVALAEQRYGPVFYWLNNDARKDEVVIADFEISDMIPIYTSLNAVSVMDGHYYLVADEEQLLERMFLPYRLDGLKADQAQQFFIENREDISKKIYGQRYRKIEGGYGEIPDEKLIEFAKKYEKFSAISLKELLRKYKASYLVWDIASEPAWFIERYPFLNLVFETDGLKIYQVE